MSSQIFFAFQDRSAKYTGRKPARNAKKTAELNVMRDREQGASDISCRRGKTVQTRRTACKSIEIASFFRDPETRAPVTPARDEAVSERRHVRGQPKRCGIRTDSLFEVD